MDKKLENSKYVKTILMMTVILGHSCAFWSGHWFTENPVFSSKVLAYIFDWVSSFHVFAFTLAAGYIFSYKVIKGGYKEFSSFLKSKLRRIIIPYVFVMIFWVAPISYYFFRYDTGYFIRTFILGINPSQLWFLWMLFDVFMIIWPFRYRIIDNLAFGYLFACCLYFIGLAGSKVVPNIFCIWTACKYIIFFVTGMRLYIHDNNVKAHEQKWVPVCLIIMHVVSFGSSVLITNNGGVNRGLIVVINVTTHMIGALMAWYVLHALVETVLHTEAKRVNYFDKLSQYSMPIYLFHQQVIYISIAMLNGKIDPYINALINLCCGLLGAYIISAVLSKNSLTRRMIGQ